MILNTQQIILLCLLVSFVTSIATGITVVSLLQQSPEPVTQTINRVIERTVETVTQQPIEDIKNIISQAPSKPSKEVVTVVVNQEDQSINAVAKNESSIVRLYSNAKNETFITMGIVVNQAGDILVDKRMVDKRGTYLAYYGSRKFTVKSQPSMETTDFITLKITTDSPNDFTAATFGDSASLKLAQSVISLSGSSQTSVSTGEIESLNKASDGSLVSLKTSVDGQNVLTGSVLLNLTGSIIGIKVATLEDRTMFMPINNLKSQISAP
jgi:flavin-binding protein dodecin